MSRKVFLIAIAVFLCAAAILAPQTSQAAAQKMRVVYGFDREFPPFSFEDPGGKPVGFEVEVLEAIFKDSVTFVPRPVQWDIIPTELASGTITITSGMVKTEERSKQFGFATLPTFHLQIRLFTKTYNRYPNATFLRGQRVSVEQGSYQHRLLENFGGINIKAYKDKIVPVKALYNDEVEAYCGPMQNAYYYMNKLGYGGISTMGTPLGITELRYAVNRDRGDVLRMLNEGMKEIVENGEYDRIYRKWFVRELSADEGLKLLNAAKEATLTAYTPYTRQTRGAAVLTATGQ
ncbi:transporter substrate-binding domain-containing protein, partial [Desulfovibrio sp. OttesenSCG-928-O18]|nr:transporter substrate-binding domain-containing protein [Desulfovibrio sp. OttesenSCG-928-O18]